MICYEKVKPIKVLMIENSESKTFVSNLAHWKTGLYVFDLIEMIDCLIIKIFFDIINFDNCQTKIWSNQTNSHWMNFGTPCLLHPKWRSNFNLSLMSSIKKILSGCWEPSLSCKEFSPVLIKIFRSSSAAYSSSRFSLILVALNS